jgi:hypothetical protein
VRAKEIYGGLDLGEKILPRKIRASMRSQMLEFAIRKI